MTGVWNFSALKAGRCLAPGPAMAATFATIAGRLPLRVGPGALAATGMAHPPSLAGAATASLPPARFATGSAVFTMSRQLGFVLGVASLIAVLGSVDAVYDVAALSGACAALAIPGR